MAQQSDEDRIRELFSGLRGRLEARLLKKPLIQLTVTDLLVMLEEVAIETAGMK